MKKIICIAVAFTLFAITAAAQNREPSKPIRPFVFKSKQSVAEFEGQEVFVVADQDFCVAAHAEELRRGSFFDKNG